MSTKRNIARLAGWSIVIACLVLALKTAAWWITGSVALYSDAVESVVNVVTASLAWIAIRISHRPADKGHPFGHYKAEYFSAVVAGVLIVIAALLIFTEAASALITPHTLQTPLAGMAVNAVAAVINGLWAWRLISEGRRARSPALSADGRHILVDVVTSAGVLIGLVLVLATGWLFLDSLIAIAVGINVLIEGWKVITSSVDGLMDSALDDEETERIRHTILESAAGAMEVHDIKTRMAGHISFIEFHLVVDGKMSVADSHAICNRVEEALGHAIPGANITIHVEPDEESKRDGLPIGK
ncbi:cation diffusion facilitator family transporter [Hoeflea sp. TYP-13]|uniref:cation diffusion facilitator family transporter n=1 Tax=Hoeflea sp. TYP-13 TaxID=3230023 RepID=UPI0034C67B23